MTEDLTVFDSRHCAGAFQPRSTSRTSASRLTRPQELAEIPATPGLIWRMWVEAIRRAIT